MDAQDNNVVDLAAFRARRTLERRREAFAERRMVAWYPLYGTGFGFVWGFTAQGAGAGNTIRGVSRAQV